MGEDTLVVFPGPCGDKRWGTALEGASVDAILTFAKATAWLNERRRISFEQLQPLRLGSSVPAWARLVVLTDGINRLKGCRRVLDELARLVRKDNGCGLTGGGGPKLY
ncbi:MAG TPA: hypothetical protein GXX40_08215 [Firmicutes bacterium]|nr:hypothetical protein [Bacillota bacterium]